MIRALFCLFIALISLIPGRASAQELPPGLPRHFGLGLTAHPDETGIYGWMPDSGIPWDYAYQYLAAGVNTGNGWETWNTNAQFPLFYARGAAERGYIPVFPYYQLFQSRGACDRSPEHQKVLANLNDPALMNRYYQNFALLMQRLGSGTHGNVTGFGGLAIVHVEPDLSGYAQQAVLDNRNCFGFCTAQGNDPALLRASVASSSYPAVAGYPNTFQGFHWALAHLRDLYAPNVLLALHVSNWTTYVDISSDTRPDLDAEALGRLAGEFTAATGIRGVPAGTSAYDLIFNDVADRDAAYYKYVVGRQVWWDRLNVSVPNFKRWEEYLGGVYSAAGRPIIVWQIPEGNQHFAVVNNTNGHYQDNRAEYLFDHIPDLAAVGVIALLFGPGNAGSTTHYDGTRDGVRNPPGICSTDGLSSGEICATAQSTVADDDGGYIRMRAADYYARGPYALGQVTSPAEPLDEWSRDQPVE